jgi:hypothetical protein
MDENLGHDLHAPKKKSQSKSVYAILEKPGKRTYWMKVGIAFLNHDQSWNVYLDVLPLDGKLQIRDEDQRPRNQAAASGAERPLPSFDLEAIQ